MSRPAALPDPHPDALPWKGPEIQSGSLQGYHLKNGHKLEKQFSCIRLFCRQIDFPIRVKGIPVDLS